jgi:hypothetical protein
MHALRILQVAQQTIPYSNIFIFIFIFILVSIFVRVGVQNPM